MAEQVKLGIIGTGGFAHAHVRRLQEVPEAVIASLADPDPDRIAALKRSFPQLADAPACPSHEELIRNGELDGVIIASPHSVHYEQIVDSLRAGLHVLTEKPMASTSEDALSVIEEEKKAGRLVAIGYQRHAQGEFQFIRESIQSGRAGQVQYVNAFQGQNWMAGTTGTWRQQREISCGGQLNDSGSHLIDAILWVTGLQAERVSASIRSFDREVDINSGLTVDFAGGALGTFSVVGNCPLWWEDITIVCSRWSFFMRQGQLTYCTGPAGEVLALKSTHYGSDSPDRNFVEAILGRADVLAPSVCGLRTIELTEAAWKSAETGQPVLL
ncbi:MAG: Gfo/Idh/MocA family protein [Planctomycetota bacterium]|jgi:predicted dehydrogenase